MKTPIGVSLVERFALKAFLNKYSAEKSKNVFFGT